MATRRSVLAGLAATGFGLAPSRAFSIEPQEDTVRFDDPDISLTPAIEERHSIFLSGLAALVCDRWSIEKADKDIRAEYAQAFPGQEFCEYGGHNIGALVVNARDEIVCFALNQNRRFNSPLEHAETRAVRRAIELTNTGGFREGSSSSNYDVMLTGYKVYTTLESCTLCSGVMDLANISAVIYAQEDSGQHRIGNLLYHLSKDQGARGAALPIRAAFFSGYELLTMARAEYDLTDSGGATAFLRSLFAYRAFRVMREAFWSTTEPRFESNRWTLNHVRSQVALRMNSGCGIDDA